MDAIHKLTSVISRLEPNSAYAVRTHPDVVNEEVFNNIEWHTETELTWAQVKAEMDKL
jgi:HD superfamily phosphohydrolase YqeK